MGPGANKPDMGPGANKPDMGPGAASRRPPYEPKPNRENRPEVRFHLRTADTRPSLSFNSQF